MNIKSKKDISPARRPNGSKVHWGYLADQFSEEAMAPIFDELKQLVSSGDLTLGKPVQEFESMFAEIIGVKHAIGVNSGTDALKLSLKAAGVGPNDEVITAANTFIATVGAIADLHAVPVFVDVTNDFCMDISQIESKITDKTKAIMPVHLAGQMANMPEIMKIADRYNLAVIEDSCQCILGNIRGKNSGTYGTAAGFSLHPLKNLNVWGDGGVAVTNSDEIASKLRLLRNHGLADRDHVVMMGVNSRLDSLHAVVGKHLIPHVEEITNTRIRNASILDEGFKDIPGIQLPTRYLDRKLVYHLYIIFAQQRDQLLAHCRQSGIQAKVHYPTPVYRQVGLSDYGYSEGDFPVTDQQAACMISFPAHEHLTDSQLDYTIQTVQNFYARS